LKEKISVPDDRGEQGQIVRYFLGQLSEAEAAALQRRQADDSAFGEFCVAVEEDLIDDFVQGRLSEEDTRCFQEHYLVTPERARKLEFARALLRSYQKLPVRPMRLAAAVLIAALSMLAVVAAVYLLRRPPEVVAFALTPGVVREIAPPQTVDLPRSALLVRLLLRTDTGPPADRATLRTVGGNDDLWAQRITPSPAAAWKF
jgi:hypothetical protein